MGRSKLPATSLARWAAMPYLASFSSRKVTHPNLQLHIYCRAKTARRHLPNCQIRTTDSRERAGVIIAKTLYTPLVREPVCFESHTARARLLLTARTPFLIPRSQYVLQRLRGCFDCKDLGLLGYVRKITGYARGARNSDSLTAKGSSRPSHWRAGHPAVCSLEEVSQPSDLNIGASEVALTTARLPRSRVG